MTENIFPLHPKPVPSVITRPTKTTLIPGREYRFTVADSQMSHPPGGMVGGYRLDRDHARVLPVEFKDGEVLAYPYDTETGESAFANWRLVGEQTGEAAQGYRLAGNSLTLSATEMLGPELVSEEPLTVLRMQPSFYLHYDTDLYAAQLGVIHLVQSQRSLLLESGEQIPLLDTPELVLYLQDTVSAEPVQIIAMAQEQGRHADIEHQLSIEQPIPAHIDHEAVQSVTVLEQYQSYFMQRECADNTSRMIWTPALPPITWGWSIRVGRRSDDEWGILRRKLILPTVGHDGLAFPVWEANHRSLRQPA